MSEMGRIRGYLERLLDRQGLSEEEAADLLEALASGALPAAMAGGLLAALRAKGESADEIRGFARAMRKLARHPALPSSDVPVVDTVGTGGDGSGSVNLSTGAGLLAAACGVHVIKHGNRSVSSRSGSADVLEVLGLPMPIDEATAARCLAETGFTFLFAPYYHPAMKAIAPVRRAMGVRTVFNILGPLTNPAAPPFQLIGAFSPHAAELMAHSLAGLPIERAFVIHGEPGWDEPTPVGPFLRFDVRPGRVERAQIDPADYGVPRCSPEALAGGDAQENADKLRAALTGQSRGGHRDALALGAALVLELTGLETRPTEALGAAYAAIDDGRAARVLEGLWRVGQSDAAVTAP